MNDAPTLGDLESVIIQPILGVIAGLIGAAAFIMLIVGGYKLLTAAGDPKKAESAQKTITGAVVGIAIIIAGWFFLNILEDQIGINLTSLSICIFGSGSNCL